MANNEFAVNIHNTRLIKVYLVCDQKTKYRNRYNLTKKIWKCITGF